MEWRWVRIHFGTTWQLWYAASMMASRSPHFLMYIPCIIPSPWIWVTSMNITGLNSHVWTVIWERWRDFTYVIKVCNQLTLRLTKERLSWAWPNHVNPFKKPCKKGSVFSWKERFKEGKIIPAGFEEIDIHILNCLWT